MRNHENERSGFVLVSVILLGVVLESFAATSLIQQVREVRMQKHSQMKSASFYAAQGAMEQALFQLADRIANFSVTQIVPDQSYPVTFSDGRTTAAYRIRCAPPTTASTPLNQCPAYLLVENGQQKTAQDFEVIATANHPDNSAFAAVFPVQAASQIHQIAILKQTSIFSYSVFYNGDLEVLPGQNMSLTGSVHANGSIYLGTRDNKTLTVDSTSVHATDNFYKTRKDNPSDAMNGTVQIRKTGQSGSCNGTTCPSLSFDSTSANWGPNATTTWNGSVQSAAHGVNYIQPVTVPSIQPNGFYHNQSDLKIVNGQAYNSSGNPVTLPAGVVTEKQFRNNRENQNYNVVVTEINVGLLNASGYFPSNGLIYVSRTDATPAAGHTSATSHGVRLVNGAAVGPSGYAGGLTVVTNNPMYVQGDFNTTNKKPVALISDAFNILSNSWSDSNSNNLSSRVASNTTVNAGIVSGIVTTQGSQYSGGLENYPRFLENWDNKSANIGGAFINLWESSIANGQWVYGGNQYTAPARNWAYDPSLQATPPPFTPLGVEVSTKAWWQDSKESLYL